jgi:hypothetical protein
MEDQNKYQCPHLQSSKALEITSFYYALELKQLFGAVSFLEFLFFWVRESCAIKVKHLQFCFKNICLTKY